LENLQRALPLFGSVGTNEVKVTPVGGGFGKEFGAGPKVFTIEEFIFDQAVDGFDVALPGVTFRWNEAVIRSQSAYGGRQAALFFVFLELAAVVGLPDQGLEIDSVRGQMSAELFGQEHRIVLGQ